MGAGILISFRYRINAAKHEQIKAAIVRKEQPAALMAEIMV